MKKLIKFLRNVYCPQSPAVSRKESRKLRKQLQHAKVMLMWALVTKHPSVICDIPDAWNDRAPRLVTIYDKMLENEGGYFTPPPSNPTLAAFKTLIDELKGYIQEMEELKPNAKQNRDAKWDEIFIAVRNLTSYVQSLCRNMPAHAQQIAGEAAMRLKVSQGRLPQGYTAKSTVDGQIEITGSIRKQHQINDWQVCLDPSDPKNWLLIKVRPSGAAKTIITGLESGKYYYVRHMAIVAGEEPYWEEPIRVKVK
jgi:hypothetical protein